MRAVPSFAFILAGAVASSGAWSQSGLSVRTPATSAPERGFFVAPLTPQGLNTMRTTMFGSRLDVPDDTGATLGYRYGNWTLRSDVRQWQPRAGEADAQMDIGASYGFDLSARNRIVIGGGMTVGSRSSLGFQAFDPLGQRSAQLAAPGAGFRLSWQYSFDRNRYVSTMLGYDRRLYDASEGGQAYDRSGASVGTVFGYRFY